MNHKISPEGVLTFTYYPTLNTLDRRPLSKQEITTKMVQYETITTCYHPFKNS